ncbi:MAG: atpE [Phycisphaerales bacterium]|nr:atpE [Phycisphaerales bacterium]
MAFRCVVVTPEMQVLDAEAKQAIVPAHDGLIGFLPGRAPILLKLGTGVLTIDGADGKKQTFAISGGVAQMKDDVLTIATTQATAQ